MQKKLRISSPGCSVVSNSSHASFGECYNILDYDEAGNKYGVYFMSRYSGMDFEGTGGKLYVSHVNNKLKVTFCSVTLNANSGNASYSTMGTGAITAP